MAIAGERTRKGALGCGCKRSRPIGERGQRGDHIAALGAAFHRQCTLTHRRKAHLGIETRRDPLTETQSLETRGGDNDCVVSSLVELAQARVDVAAQWLDLQQWIALAKLRPPSLT